MIMNKTACNENLIKSSFSDTVFIFGLARSGTAMLRALLNQSKELCIDPYEAHFLVNWMLNWKIFGDLSQKENFSQFYRHMDQYGRFGRKLNESVRGIDESTWYSLCCDFSVQGVFEGLVRCQTGTKNSEQFVLVNKTPRLVNFVSLLYESFPSAKFLHLIRDGRDTVLSQHYFSMKRFNHPEDQKLTAFWENLVKYRGKKSMVVDVQQWAEKIEKVRSEKNNFSEQYMEVKYEDLLTRPETTLKKVCGFIGISYFPEMATFRRRMKTHSDAKVSDSLLKNNFDKYIKGIESSILAEMEDVAGNALENQGYTVINSYKPKKLSRLKKAWYKLFSRYEILSAAVKELGISHGFRFFFQFNTWQYRRKQKRDSREKRIKGK